MSVKVDWSDAKTIRNIVKASLSQTEVLSKLGLRNVGANAKTLKRHLHEYNISTSHFDPYFSKIRKSSINRRLPDSIVFTVNSNYSRRLIKERILKQNLIPYICRVCGQGSIWNKNPLILQLEHKNGNTMDNRLENLEFLCPNCHSQTPTFAGRTSQH